MVNNVNNKNMTLIFLNPTEIICGQTDIHGSTNDDNGFSYTSYVYYTGNLYVYCVLCIVYCVLCIVYCVLYTTMNPIAEMSSDKLL